MKWSWHYQENYFLQIDNHQTLEKLTKGSENRKRFVELEATLNPIKKFTPGS